MSSVYDANYQFNVQNENINQGSLDMPLHSTRETSKCPFTLEN